MNIFAKVVKNFLSDNGITQNDLAEMAHINAGNLSRILNSDSLNVSLGTMTKIANALDCELVIELQPKSGELLTVKDFVNYVLKNDPNSPNKRINVRTLDGRIIFGGCISQFQQTLDNDRTIQNGLYLRKSSFEDKRILPVEIINHASRYEITVII